MTKPPLTYRAISKVLKDAGIEFQPKEIRIGDHAVIVFPLHRADAMHTALEAAGYRVEHADGRRIIFA